MDIISTVLSIIAILVSIVNFLDNRKLVIFEKKVEIYSELAYFLEKIYNNHQLAIEFEADIRGIISRAYFFASPEIHDLMYQFLDEMKSRIEYIKECEINGETRDTSYSSLDKINDTLNYAMKKEIESLRKLSKRKIVRISKLYSKNIGKHFLD